jgi:hypothetical protein
MRAIDKFILHVVHNLFPLNEYSASELTFLMTQFREEADDLNIKISDDQLKKYIERFDILKNSPKIQNKNLRTYTLSKLIKLVTSSAGAETPEDDEDQTPDVVYQNGGITIWNGSKEGNCITYGRGEKWCITRGSFGNYRYDSSKGYPVFYLAKNTNISDSDKLSFVAIQVRNLMDYMGNEEENKKYVYTDRSNSPYESQAMNFSALLSKIPWLNDIPNIKEILRYIPLNSEEKITQQYKNAAVSIREWIKMPFNTKKQYLVVRKLSGRLFSDVERKEFVEKYLPQYPQIAEFIVITPGIVDDVYLLANLDKFNNQDRRSITANIQTPIDLKYLLTEDFPFDVKKLLTVLKKWNIKSDERLYVTKDGEAIVRLKFGDTVNIGVYTAEDDYPNIKLNQRTSKYLLDYPELDKIPFNVMIKLATDGVIDKSLLDTIIEKAKTDENSAIVVKEINGKEIIVDSNSFASYKIEDGKVTKIPFDDEDVQTVFAAEKDNLSFQQSAVDTIKIAATSGENLPSRLDKEAFLSIVKATPYDKRTYTDGRYQYVILIPEGQGEKDMFVKSANLYDNMLSTLADFGRAGDWREYYRQGTMGEREWRTYFSWMRNENKVYESEPVIRTWRGTWGSIAGKKAWFASQPPFSPTDQYTPAVSADGTCYLVNKQNSRESLKLSDSAKLVKANIPASMARQLIGTTPDEATPVAAAATTPVANAAAPAAGRRGRPVGVANAPRAAAPAAAAGGGNINVAEVMDETGLVGAFNGLPRADRNRLIVGDGVRITPNGDRGAARRNNQLGAAGNVGRVIGVGASKIYIIRLANQQIIASINIQPGNRNYVLLPNGTALTLNSPAELVQVLRQRNLIAEVRNYIVREYLAQNPRHLDEVRGLIQQHVNETKRK